MTQLVNQFSQSPEKGDLDLKVMNNVVTCIVASDESTALVAGQPVKIVDNYSPIPTVTALDATTDEVFGFVVRNLKDQDFAANAPVEIALKGSVMFMEASAAIARWAALSPVISGEKVVTATGAATVIGRAYDKAAADTDIVRVYIDPINISLTQLTDVFISSPADTQVLKYDGATDNRWENAADAT